jgi:hypothetical protein
MHFRNEAFPVVFGHLPSDGTIVAIEGERVYCQSANEKDDCRQKNAHAPKIFSARSCPSAKAGGRRTADLPPLLVVPAAGTEREIPAQALGDGFYAALTKLPRRPHINNPELYPIWHDWRLSQFAQVPSGKLRPAVADSGHKCWRAYEGWAAPLGRRVGFLSRLVADLST